MMATIISAAIQPHPILGLPVGRGLVDNVLGLLLNPLLTISLPP
jgi:hypothetical protein